MRKSFLLSLFVALSPFYQANAESVTITGTNLIHFSARRENSLYWCYHPPILAPGGNIGTIKSRTLRAAQRFRVIKSARAAKIQYRLGRRISRVMKRLGRYQSQRNPSPDTSQKIRRLNEILAGHHNNLDDLISALRICSGGIEPQATGTPSITDSPEPVPSGTSTVAPLATVTETPNSPTPVEIPEPAPSLTPTPSPSATSSRDPSIPTATPSATATATPATPGPPDPPQSPINRMASGMPNGSVNYRELARNHSMIIKGSNFISGFEAAKDENPDVINYVAVSLAMIRYNLAQHDPDPREQGGWINWAPENLQYSFEAIMADAVRQNLLMGVDWLIRKPDGVPVEAQPYYALACALDYCPEGVWSWTAGLTFMQASALTIHSLANKDRWRAALDGFHFDMGFKLSSTGSNEIDQYVPDYLDHWEGPARGFAESMKTVPANIMVNARGESPVWIGEDGSTDNRNWVDNYKMESFMVPNAWYQDLPWPEFFHVWRKYFRNSADGGWWSGLLWIRESTPHQAQETWVQVSPKLYWGEAEIERHIRMCLGLFLLVATNESGPYFAANLYSDQTPLDPADYPIIGQLVNLRARGEAQEMLAGVNTIYVREFEGETPGSVVELRVNPNPYEVSGVPAKDIAVIYR